MTAPHLAALLAAGATLADMPVAAVVAPTKVPATVRVRDAIAWSVRHRFGTPLQAIAALLGRDDHSTVSAMIARADRRLTGDPGFRALTEALLAANAPPPPAPPAPRDRAPRPAPPASEPVGSAGVVPSIVPPTAPVERDPCFRCGIRADLGCRHQPPSRPADPFRFDRIAA